MNKFFRKILICVLVFTSLITAYGSVQSDEDDASSATIISSDEIETFGILTNAYGESYYVVLQDENISVRSNALPSERQALTTSVVINPDNLIPASATDYNYRERWDSTGSIKAYTTIYFQTSGLPETYLLTRATGGFSFEDLNVSVTNQELVMGCNGSLPSPVFNQKIIKNPTGTSFAYNTGFTQYVLPRNSNIGTTYTLTLVRHGDPWTLQFMNQIPNEY